MKTMNDHELTKARQEEQAKNGIQKGFPIHLITVIEGRELKHKCFFSFKGMREYLELREYDDYIYNLVYVDDVKNVKFEI